MHRLIRIGMIVALVVSIGGWTGLGHGLAQGTTWTDTMDSEATGLLSSQSPDPTRFSFRYGNGQFVIESLQPGWSGDLFAYFSTPVLGDSRAAVDFAIAGDLTGKYAFIGCRDDGNDTGYSLDVSPDTGRASLWRYDVTDVANLATIVDPSVVNIGSANNRIEIVCQGTTISGIVNGQQLLTVQDATYASGKMFLGVGKSSETDALMLAGFDNLSITDLAGGSQPAQPTQPAEFPTAIPAQPTQQTELPTSIPVEPTAAVDTGGSSGLTITDPRINPGATAIDLLLYSAIAAPASGPWYTEDTLGPSEFKFLVANVDLSEVYSTVSFITPPTDPSGIWAIGFAFWAHPDDYYDLFFQVDGPSITWKFGHEVGDDYEIIGTGTVAPGGLDLTPGAENTISLAVVQGMALLISDDFGIAASVDLTGMVGSGGVMMEVGFRAADPNTPLSLPVSITEFLVWDASAAAVATVFGDDGTTPGEEPTQIPVVPTEVPAIPTQIPVQPTEPAIAPTVALPPVTPTTDIGMASEPSGAIGMMLTKVFNQERSAAMAGSPLASIPSGMLQQKVAGFGFTPAGVLLADFYATATFVNPSDLSTPSDAGIGFRDVNDDQEFRFVVRSTGEWALAIGPALPIMTGAASNFDSAPGASNTIEIVARGATGFLAVNGVVVQQIDLSVDMNAGEVWIASGMYVDDAVEGRQVPFSNFVVYALPA